MTQRTWAALVAVPLFVALGLYMAVSPLPFVTYAPGLTINVLGDNGDKPIISVEGHRAYHDDGQLRMTTVSVTQRDAKLDLITLMWTWGIARDDAIYPYAIQYGDSGTQEQDTEEGQVEMIRSQDSAIAAALRQLGYPVHPALEILAVTPDMPADGKLHPRDVVRRFNGTRVTAATQLAKLIAEVPAGRSATMSVERKGKPVTLRVTPVTKDGHKLIGVTLGLGYTFPFKVTVNINEAIGGPSAGLMFALSIYDTLTPGSLTSGGTVAGTGTIDGRGTVGEIGGIQQKIAGARQDGAQLFLVPPANCPDALTSDHGSMRLAKAATLKDAIAELDAWGKNHDAPLPQCTAADGPKP
jgi:PDZ domain-containing protein